jgi:predicted cupin superfamily sugar epimerase
MRLVAQIPHPQLKISIMMYNEKYIIEMEGGQYKQTYKISADSVSGLEGVKALCTPELIDGTLQRFSLMHQDFSTAFKSLSNS